MEHAQLAVPPPLQGADCPGHAANSRSKCGRCRGPGKHRCVQLPVDARGIWTTFLPSLRK
jgi:hypothetical protein